MTEGRLFFEPEDVKSTNWIPQQANYLKTDLRKDRELTGMDDLESSNFLDDDVYSPPPRIPFGELSQDTLKTVQPVENPSGNTSPGFTTYKFTPIGDNPEFQRRLVSETLKDLEKLHLFTIIHEQRENQSLVFQLKRKTRFPSTHSGISEINPEERRSSVPTDQLREIVQEKSRIYSVQTKARKIVDDFPCPVKMIGASGSPFKINWKEINVQLEQELMAFTEEELEELGKLSHDRILGKLLIKNHLSSPVTKLISYIYFE
ncbi:hypothetical protein 1 [Xingshan nematode virus 4]|uniref:Uncharacterized protein n=1 Tax=Xingshan nematode virus 4 TaxID=1923763 RepID=A0A1L3KN92_9RHAB|nr:hypothetical protein 1 [Xingshan nematode virus 4]APG78844.1 hypothetical protein 1 [Xingshan nematode virus 4]